ncbi:MAG: porin family protein [Candidatus Calescibacterium sp.]|nr:porin family protein [Candidatus Calescibacterium sp.]
MLKNIIKVSIIFMCVAYLSWGSGNINGPDISFSLGGDFVGIDTVTADFSFFAPSFGLHLGLGDKFKANFNYITGEDSVGVGNSNFDLNWRQFNTSLDYKLINDDKSLWLSLLYRQFEISSSWQNMSDKDSWNGLGIGISYKPKLSENFYGSLSINYFPTLTSGIGDYSNLELSGSVEYKFKNNEKFSLILHYTNQNLSSLSEGVDNLKINQAGLKFKMKI